MVYIWTNIYILFELWIILWKYDSWLSTLYGSSCHSTCVSYQLEHCGCLGKVIWFEVDFMYKISQTLPILHMFSLSNLVVYESLWCNDKNHLFHTISLRPFIWSTVQQNSKCMSDEGKHVQMYMCSFQGITQKRIVVHVLH